MWKDVSVSVSHTGESLLVGVLANYSFPELTSHFIIQQKGMLLDCVASAWLRLFLVLTDEHFLFAS